VFPALFEGKNKGILQDSMLVDKGILTERFNYLEDFVKGG
jgi:hypothetical protein